MKEFVVSFASVEEIRQFASIVNRQSFSVQILTGETVLDASSIMNLCYMGLHRPLQVRIRENVNAEAFCQAIEPFLVKDGLAR